MRSSRPITTTQAMAVISSTFLGIGFLTLPRYMADAGGSSAPFVALTGFIFAFFSFCIIALLCRCFPKESIFMFSRRLIGRPISIIFTIIIFLYFLLITGINAREFSEVVTIVLFKETPIEITILLMLLIVLLSSRRDIVKFSYIHFFYLPFIVISFLFTIIISLKNVDLLNLQPLLTTPTPAFWNGTLLASILFQGSFVITVLIPAMKKPKQILIAGTLAFLLAGGIYLLIVVASVGLFGPEETKLLTYPALEMARSATVGVGVLERLDAIFIVFWIMSVFTTIYTTYYLTAFILQTLFSLTDQRMASTALLPFIFAISMLPSNIFQTYEMVCILGAAGIIVLTGYPLLLWVMILLRRLRKATSS